MGQGGDTSAGGDVSSATGDASEGGIGKSLRKSGQTSAIGGVSGGSAVGGSGNVRSTRRSAAAAVALAAGGNVGSLGTGFHEDCKAKMSEFGIPLDHPVNTENYR